jgi:membrane associated rhomboid family serine protease
MEQADKNKLLKSLFLPAILLALIWIIKIVETLLKADFSELGLYPQHLSGLKGILFSPLLHGSWAHLSANSVPLFVLTAGLVYYYNRNAYIILALAWFMTGLWVWIFAKDTGIHIGASGIVYALAGFHFTNGLIRKEPRMMAFSLLVVFLYGGLIWGVIPNFLPDKNISWESHLLGLLAGFILAFFYKPDGFQQKVYSWESEDPDDPDEEPAAFIDNESEDQQVSDESGGPDKQEESLKVIYHIKKQ